MNYDKLALTSEPGGPDRLRLVPVSDTARYQPAMLHPLLPIPLGTLGVICGTQGYGKSLLTCWLAAELTRRGNGVVFLSEEDAVGPVIRPRLEAANANLTRVFTVEATREDDVGGVLLPEDTAELERLVVAESVRLVVLDPWTNHVNVADLDKGVVRGALMPLVKLTAETGAVVVLVAHPTKRTEGDPLSQIAHSSAVTQLSRWAFFLTLDPDADGGLNKRENPYRLLSHVKANLTAESDTARFRIEERLLLAEDGQPEMRAPALVPDGGSELDYLTIREKVRKLERRAAPEQRQALTDACEWLAQRLAGGPVAASTIRSEGEAAGHAWRTLQRASETELPVAKEQPSPGQPGTWRLRPPELGAQQSWRVGAPVSQAGSHVRQGAEVGAQGKAPNEEPWRLSEAVSENGRQRRQKPVPPSLAHGDEGLWPRLAAALGRWPDPAAAVQEYERAKLADPDELRRLVERAEADQ